MPMHPCRKIKITEEDKKIFAALQAQGPMDFIDLFNKLQLFEKQELKKRLTQLKKHKLIAGDSNLNKLRLLDKN